MATEITMPQLSDTMNDGKILTWHKKEGDIVKRGEALAEVATDKADLEIECFHPGQILKILAPAGETVKVGQVIALIGEAGEKAGESVSSATTAAPAPKPAASAPVVAPVPQAAPQVSTQTSTSADNRVKISPLAKNVAKSQGIDYTAIQGSGEGGRILRRDIDGVKPAAPAMVAEPHKPALHSSSAASSPVQTAREAVVPSGTVQSSDLSKMRQTIASRMVESKTSIPHFYMTVKVHADALLKMKDSLKPLPQYEGLTVNHLMIKATALALRSFPRVNSAYVGGRLQQPQDVNVGVVTAVPDGLLIPVVKAADQLHLSDIVSDARALISRARSGRPKGDDLTGATFSISNVGNFPVESFSAIISPGQGAILAISGTVEEPIVVGGALTVGQVVRLTLSVDHRIIDGVMGAEFLKELKRLIEDPILLLA